ncbi:hypothetical protein N9N38_03470 [Candidatus Pelagibacter bacterium]|nr:hypothetical protein [Candidatus Pelagibacter bacterium]MDA8841775.1 hypothetical protein [Candidatus Pelagibacter bacterium]
MLKKNISYIKNTKDLFDNDSMILEYQNKIKNGGIIIIKNLFKKKKINQLKKYLIKIGQNSLAQYQPVKIGAPNHHRIINEDPRSIVRGAFHQFSFYRWNQDLMDVFSIFEKGFWIKNILSNRNKNDFLKIESNFDDNFVARVSIQFYPSGIGYLNEHSDPVGEHQISAPLVVMSDKGAKKDFLTGGSYFYGKNKKKFYIEDIANIGDLVIYDSSLPHGVELIDEKNKDNDWFDFNGRWTAVLATNKVEGSSATRNSVDLQKK